MNPYRRQNSNYLL